VLFINNIHEHTFCVKHHFFFVRFYQTVLFATLQPYEIITAITLRFIGFRAFLFEPRQYEQNDLRFHRSSCEILKNLRPWPGLYWPADASTFATHGLQVWGRCKPAGGGPLKEGELHIYEPGLRTLVQAALRSGNLVIEPQPQPADAFIIAVPTPFKEDKKRRYALCGLRHRIDRAAPARGNLVVLESTSPPRTTVDVVRPILERSGLKAGEDFFLAYSPERVLPGQILRELIENARVIGGIDRASAEAGRDLYAIFVRGEII
jgi:hypothetical protein